MIFYSERIKVRRWVQDNYRYHKTNFLSKFVSGGEKKVYIEIGEIALNRYLYNFIKFFVLNDYTVYISKNRKAISILNRERGEFQYSSWILKEQVKIGRPKKANLVLSKNILSNDYFGEKRENSYYVPMSQYPGMYYKGIEQKCKETEGKRNRSIFMAGNMAGDFYSRISKTGFFDILSRREVADFVGEQTYHHGIKNLNELKAFLNEKVENKVILIDTSEQFRIPLNEIKDILRRFDFYLALPGIIIPQSHNLIEAMAMGTIPVIHKTYANLMSPVLTHMENSLIYDSLEELHELILGTFKIEQNQVDWLHENVLDYYKKYLTPSAVVKNIEENNYSQIYIQAEEKSLALLKSKI